jgi:hypothetical protein
MNDVEAEATDDEHDPKDPKKKRRRLGSAPAGATLLIVLLSTRTNQFVNVPAVD